MKGGPDIDLSEFSSTPINNTDIEQNDDVPAVRRQKAQRVGPQNTMKKMVLGRPVTFTREVIEAGQVETRTSVFFLNERDQELLNEHAVADILTSIKTNKINDFEAYARSNGDKRELADGSRRRRACILAKAALAMWVADLSDREMEYLSESGNKHKQASVYERGLVYNRWIKEGRYLNNSDIARERKIGRRTVQRCRNAAELPKWLVSAFRTPNDMSAESSERLYTMMTIAPIDKEILKRRVASCQVQWSNENFTGADITKILLEPVNPNKKPEPKWLIKNKVKVTPTSTGVRYDLPNLDDKQQKELDDFVKGLLKK